MKRPGCAALTRATLALLYDTASVGIATDGARPFQAGWIVERAGGGWSRVVNIQHGQSSGRKV